MEKITLTAIKIIKEYECLYLIPSDNIIGYKTPIIEELPQQKITEEIAEKKLYEYLFQKYVPLINGYNIIYFWEKNEFSALLSFLYNNKAVDIDTLLEKGKIKKKDIPKKMIQYCYEGGKVFKALIERRNKEIALFKSKIILDCNKQYEIKETNLANDKLKTGLNLTIEEECILMMGVKANPDLYFLKNSNNLQVHILDSHHYYSYCKCDLVTNHQKINPDDYCILLGEKNDKLYDVCLIKSKNTSSNKIELEIIEGNFGYRRQKHFPTSLPAINQRDLTIDFAFDDYLDLFCFFKYKNNKEKNKIIILEKKTNYTSILLETQLIFDDSYKCYVSKYKGITSVFGIKPYNGNNSIEMSILNPNKEFSEIIFKTSFNLEASYDELVFHFGEYERKNCIFALTKSFSHPVFIYIIYI